MEKEWKMVKDIPDLYAMLLSTSFEGNVVFVLTELMLQSNSEVEFHGEDAETVCNVITNSTSRKDECGGNIVLSE